MPRTTDELILEKIDQILRILAAAATTGMKQREQIALLNRAGLQPKNIAELLRTRPRKKQREQIALLNRAGLQPKNIAELLGTSSNTVRVELVTIRKPQNKKAQIGRAHV